MTKNKNIGFGMFVIGMGVLWLLRNLGIIGDSIIWAMIVLSPLILVVIGISIIFDNNIVLKILCWTVFFVAVCGYSYLHDIGKINKQQYHFDYFINGNGTDKTIFNEGSVLSYKCWE